MDDIATYSDALPDLPDVEQLPEVPSDPGSLQYPESDGFLTFPDNYFENFADYNQYYLDSRSERDALANIDYNNQSTALLQLEYIRTYEMIKIKTIVMGIFIFLIFVYTCKFFRRWIGGK